MGTLPATRQWRAVVALITGGHGVAPIAAATAEAAERSLEDASRDTSLRHAFWLLTQIPLAARKDNFGEALRALGLRVSDAPNLIQISTAMLEAIDRDRADAQYNDDLCEIVSKAATSSLTILAARSETSLFGTTYEADEARASLRGLSTNQQFGLLARDFMARLTEGFIGYFLSRALPEHVGTHRRFQSIKDHHAFDKAMTRHCRETSLIVEQFAADWFSKTNFDGGITQAKAGGFIHVALGKIRAELKARRLPGHA